MRFNDRSPIYEQIADAIAADAVTGRIAPNGRLPSARELAASLEVNPNTAARALQALAERGVARAERGTGYYLADDGQARAREDRRRRFYEEEMPRFFAVMDELGLTPSDLTERWSARKETSV